MRTLADLKRRLAVPGAVINLTENTAAPQPAGHPAWLPRTVHKLQTTCFVSLVDGKKWWMDFGKASEWTFDGDVATRSLPRGRISFRVTVPPSTVGAE